MTRPFPHRDHLGDDHLRGEDGAAEVHVERLPPVVGVDLPQGADGSHDSGVVDQEVDRAEGPADHPDGLAKVGRVGDVGHRRPTNAARSEDQGRGLGELGLGAGDDADGYAGPGQVDGHHPADASPAPGDEGDCARGAVRFHGETMRSPPGAGPEHGLLIFGSARSG